jgi:TRAP-type C4-dicarboxylate transport system permease small subunit
MSVQDEDQDEHQDEHEMKGMLLLPGPLLTGLRMLIATTAFAMMALIFIDVFMRYIFSAPIPGAFEIEQFMLALLVFFSLPIVVWADENISVALFSGWFRGRAGFALKSAVMVVNICGLCLLGALVLRQYGSLQRSQQVTGYLEFPIYPLAMVMVVMVALAVVIQCAMLWQLLRSRNPGKPL